MFRTHRLDALFSTSTRNERVLRQWRSGVGEEHMGMEILPPFTLIYVTVSIRDFEQQQLHSLFNSIEFIIGKIFFEEIFELEAVYFDKEGDVINVWSVLRDFSRSVREKVYAKEVEVVKKLPSLVFNFRTTDAQGEIIPASSGFKKVSREFIHA